MNKIKNDVLGERHRLPDKRLGSDRRLHGDRRASARRHVDIPDPTLTKAEIAALLRVGEKGE